MKCAMDKNDIPTLITFGFIALGVALVIAGATHKGKLPEPGMFACVNASGVTAQIRGVNRVEYEGNGVYHINPGGMHYTQKPGEETCFDHVIAYGSFPAPLDSQVTR